MIIVSILLLWSIVSISIGVVVWRKIRPEVKVYALIVVSGFHLSGILIFYGLMNRISIL